MPRKMAEWYEAVYPIRQYGKEILSPRMRERGVKMYAKTYDENPDLIEQMENTFGIRMLRVETAVPEGVVRIRGVDYPVEVVKGKLKEYSDAMMLSEGTYSLNDFIETLKPNPVELAVNMPASSRFGFDPLSTIETKLNEVKEIFVPKPKKKHDHIKPKKKKAR